MNRVEKLSSKGLNFQKQIYIWGLDFWTKALIVECRNAFVEPCAIICDSGYHIECAWGIKVIHDANNIYTNKDKYLLISRQEYALNKKKILNDYGFMRNRVLVECRFLHDTPLWKTMYYETSSIDFFDRLIHKAEVTKNEIERMVFIFRGYKVYKALRKQYGWDTKFLFFNYTGTGDVFLCCLGLENYLTNNSIRNYRMFTFNKACEKVAKLFGYDRIETLDRIDAVYFRAFVYFAGEEATNVKMLIKWPNHQDIVVKMDCSHLTLWDNYKYAILMENNPMIHYPKISSNYKEIDLLFKTKKLRKGSTVVISPFSYSEVSASCEFWIKIAKLVKGMGFDVVTMHSPKELSIPGTGDIFFEFEDANAILEYAGAFIGVRSGFCDIIQFSKCKKIFFYFENELRPNMSLSHINGGTIYEFASFERMGLECACMELRNKYCLTKDDEKRIRSYLIEDA